MLSDGKRLAKCLLPMKFCVLAVTISLMQVWFQGLATSSLTCRTIGRELNCDGLSVDRIPDGLNLQKVDSLILSSNEIQELKLQDVTKLSPTLKNLDLSNNKLVEIDFGFLNAKLIILEGLILSKNRLGEFHLSAQTNRSKLTVLDLSYNMIRSFTAQGTFSKLQRLDLKFNKLSHLPSAAFRHLPDLRQLDLSGNPIHVVPDFSFRDLISLKVLYLNSMPALIEISELGLDSLDGLELLEIKDNPHLESIEILKLPSALDVSGSRLQCDCSTLTSLDGLQSKDRFNLTGFSCRYRETNFTYLAADEAFRDLMEKCHSTLSSTSAAMALVTIGDPITISCPLSTEGRGRVMWLTNRKEVISWKVYNWTDWRKATKHERRISTSQEGDLFIGKVESSDGGNFICIRNFQNHSGSTLGFESATVSLKLDYSSLCRASFASMIVGAATAGGFFVLAAVFGGARYACTFCSRKEKRKRKSIREILEKMSGFKTAQMGRFSAYRSAKMDQLLAFKSATMDQLYAFKMARVDKLRTYKQATVTTILGHMDRMREHYWNQTNRIKDNCSQQVDKLRETYEIGCGRLKDYRCQRMERMRMNYNRQVCRVRDYGVQQVSRLREQYKTQQQYLLKLLELIDVGNCVPVIEAECLKTESVIFDADITFDLEPGPVRMPGRIAEGEETEDAPGSEAAACDDDDVEDDQLIDLEKILGDLYPSYDFVSGGGGVVAATDDDDASDGDAKTNSQLKPKKKFRKKKKRKRKSWREAILADGMVAEETRKVSSSPGGRTNADGSGRFGLNSLSDVFCEDRQVEREIRQKPLVIHCPVPIDVKGQEDRVEVEVESRTP